MTMEMVRNGMLINGRPRPGLGPVRFVGQPGDREREAACVCRCGVVLLQGGMKLQTTLFDLVQCAYLDGARICLAFELHGPAVHSTRYMDTLRCTAGSVGGGRKQSLQPMIGDTLRYTLKADFWPLLEPRLAQQPNHPPNLLAYLPSSSLRLSSINALAAGLSCLHLQTPLVTVQRGSGRGRGCRKDWTVWFGTPHRHAEKKNFKTPMSRASWFASRDSMYLGT